MHLFLALLLIAGTFLLRDNVSASAADLRIAIASEPTSLDPHFHNLTPNNSMASHIFDSLVIRDERHRLKPGLAVSWKPIDKTTWEFKLRKNVKFHDGSPFTADDVIFSFARAPEVPNSPSSLATFTKGKTFSKIDPHTIQIKTEHPHPLMPIDMSRVPIVSKKHGEGAKTEDYNSGKAMFGTGPFVMSEFVPGDRIILTRNTDYWGGSPVWDRVIFKPISSSPARLSALLAGDVDLIDNVPTANIAGLKNNDRIELFQIPSSRVIYFHMDQFRDSTPFIRSKSGDQIANPLKKLKVRKALSMAIDRDAIVSRIMEGVAVKAGQLLPKGFFGRSGKLKPVEFDPEGAKKLLAEAGYGDGFALTLHGPNDRYINDAKIVEAVAQMFTRIGLDVTVETMTRSVYFRRATRGGPGNLPEFSFFLVGWGSGTGEASHTLKSLLHTYDKDRGFGAVNRGRYSNPELDKLIQEALSTVDETKREKLLEKATEIAIEDVGLIPLHYQVNTWAARKGFYYRARIDNYTNAHSVSKTKD